ncbi:MAG: hypothetical protein WEA58_07025 [Balneolaceae bacterium]
MQNPFLKFSFFIVLALFITGCYQDVTDVNNGNDDDNNNGELPGEFSHKNTPGDSNEDFVTNQEFDNLVIEIQYMPGMEPDEESLNNLLDFLDEHLDKTDITILVPQSINSLNQTSYTLEDLQDLEDENREVYSEESTLAAYILIVDGSYFGGQFEEPTRLSISTYNTSIALFGGTIDRISGPLTFEPSKLLVETNSMNHQFGHLMGLVDLSTEMVDEHLDSPNDHHCTNQECLMHFRVNSTEFFDSQFDDQISVLDNFCVDDLHSLIE